MPNEALGIDIGGVIIQRLDAASDTSFHKDFLKTPAVFGALETIWQLVDLRFGANVHLISKCGAKVEALTQQWLEAHAFPASGVRPENIHFCRQRSGKAPICEALGITHFIDDRLEVLSYLKSVPNLFLFQPVPDEVRKFARHLDRAHVVQGWGEIGEALLPPR